MDTKGLALNGTLDRCRAFRREVHFEKPALAVYCSRSTAISAEA